MNPRRLLLLVLLVVCAPTLRAAGPDEIVLLHINDLHGHGLPREYLGADMPASFLHAPNGALFAAATRVRQLRDELFAKDPEQKARFEKDGDDGILFLEAGDTWSGTLDDAVTKGQNVVEFLRSPFLDVDVSCPGNHAWDFGQKRWEELSRRLAEHHPLVCANLTRAGAALPFLAPWIVVNVRGVRVGIVGLLTATAIEESLPENTKGLEVADAVGALEKALDAMQARPADERPELTIVLSHVGFDRPVGKGGKRGPGFQVLAAMDDDKPGDDAKRARNVDLVVDGHSHLDLQEQVDANTWVVQADHYALRLGEVRIPWDPVKRRIAGKPAVRRMLLFDQELAADPGMLQAERDRVEKARAKNEEKLAASEPDLALPCVPRADHDNLDSASGDVLMRAVLDVYNAKSSKQNKPADCALINQSGVREGLYASRFGMITAGAVHAVCPFSNAVEVCEVSARDLLMLLARQGIQSSTRWSWAGLSVGVLQEGRGQHASGHRKLTAVWLEAPGGRVNLMEPAEANRVVRVLAPSFLMSHVLAPVAVPGSRKKVGASDNQMLRDYLKLVEKRDKRVTAKALAKAVGEPVKLVYE